MESGKAHHVNHVHQDKYVMWNTETTRFTKTIAIDPEDLKFIEETRSKKSRAGRLSQIIKSYKSEHYGLSDQGENKLPPAP